LLFNGDNLILYWRYFVI